MRNISLKKGIGIILGCIVFGVSLMVILLLTKPWLTKEERILNQIMGIYAYEEYIGSYEDPNGLETHTRSKVPYYWIYPDSFGFGGKEENTFGYGYIKYDITNYTIKEIDEEYFNTANPITFSLKRCLIPDLNILRQYKEKYLLLVDKKIEHISPITFFYLDGTLYTSEQVWKLKKIENTEHPLSVQKDEIPIASLFNEIAGKTFFCEYFTIYDPKSDTYSISFDKSQTENETVEKKIQYAVFTSNKYIMRFDSIEYNFSGVWRYTIYDNPNYKAVEIDEEFYNNGNPKQGFALHRLIHSVEELESYKKKYAIIINMPEAIKQAPERMTYFYLDGVLYFSPSERYPYNTMLFPMEEMKGEGITR